MPLLGTCCTDKCWPSKCSHGKHFVVLDDCLCVLVFTIVWLEVIGCLVFRSIINIEINSTFMYFSCKREHWIRYLIVTYLMIAGRCWLPRCYRMCKFLGWGLSVDALFNCRRLVMALTKFYLCCIFWWYFYYGRCSTWCKRKYLLNQQV